MMVAWTRIVVWRWLEIINLECSYKIESPGFDGGLDMGYNRLRVG